ncbi:MAG: NfeD family protein [Pseudomonadota bacterium]
MIEDLTLNHWTWLVIALVLAVLELLAPGVFFLWLAIAAAVTAAAAFALPALGWSMHLAIFAVLAVVITWAGKRYVKQNETPSDHQLLNRRADQLIGREAVLIEAIEHGSGRIKIGDSPWRVEGPDLPLGTQVRIVGVDGASLTVEAASD